MAMTREECDQQLRRMGYALSSYGICESGECYATAVALSPRPFVVADTQAAAFAKLVEQTAKLLKCSNPDLSHLTPRDRLAALVARHGEGFNAIVAAARDAMPRNEDSVTIEIGSGGVLVQMDGGYWANGKGYDFAGSLLDAFDGAIEDESEDDQ